MSRAGLCVAQRPHPTGHSGPKPPATHPTAHAPPGCPLTRSPPTLSPLACRSCASCCICATQAALRSVCPMKLVSAPSWLDCRKCWASMGSYAPCTGSSRARACVGQARDRAATLQRQKCSGYTAAATLQRPKLPQPADPSWPTCAGRGDGLPPLAVHHIARRKHACAARGRGRTARLGQAHARHPHICF